MQNQKEYQWEKIVSFVEFRFLKGIYKFREIVILISNQNKYNFDFTNFFFQGTCLQEFYG